MLADLCGPFEIDSLGKKIYFLLFKDDYSCFRIIYFLCQKLQVSEYLQKFCIEIENQFCTTVKEIVTDGGK